MRSIVSYIRSHLGSSRWYPVARESPLEGGTVVFIPEGAGRIVGLILTDSLSILGWPRRSTEEWNVLPEVLRRLYHQGARCFAGFCIPGATIAPTYRRTNGERSSMLYVEALSIALKYLSVARVERILLVSGGSDFYQRAMLSMSDLRMELFRVYFRSYARELLYALTDATDSSGMVIGGSAAAWGYHQSNSWVKPFAYDALVRMAYWRFCLAIPTTCGETQFRMLQKRDRIGHVHYSSRDDLAGMLVQWVLEVGMSTRKARL